MNEEAIQVAYDLFVENGYTKGLEDFKTLMNTNQEAVTTAYEIFVSDGGYTKPYEDFVVLMGINTEKKNPNVPPTSEMESTESAIDQNQDASTSSASSVQTPAQQTDEAAIDQDSQETPVRKLWKDLSQQEQEVYLNNSMGNIAAAQKAFNEEQALQALSNKVVGQISEISNKYKEYVPYVDPEQQIDQDQFIADQGIRSRSESFGGAKILFKGLKDKITGLYRMAKGDVEGASEAFTRENRTREYTYKTDFGRSAPKGGFVRDYIESDDPFENSMQQVWDENIDQPDQNVAALYNYHFGDYGFTFEEATNREKKEAGEEFDRNDVVKVTSANGDEMYLNRDSDQRDLAAFLRKNKEASSLAYQIEEGYIEKQKKFQSREQVEKTIKKFHYRSDKVMGEMRDFLALKTMYLESGIRDLPTDQVIYIDNSTGVLSLNQPEGEENNVRAMTAGQLEKELMTQAFDLSLKDQELARIGAELDEQIGAYYMMESLQGRVSGILYNEFLRGWGDRGAGWADLVIDASTYIADKVSGGKALGGATLDELRKEIKWGDNNAELMGVELGENIYSDFVNMYLGGKSGGMLDGIGDGYVHFLGDEATTHEYTKKQMSRGDRSWMQHALWTGLYGTARSLPMFIGRGPGKASARVTTVSSAYARANEAISKNPYFDDISELEKKLISVPIGITVGILEEVGFRNVMESKGLMTSVLMRVLGKTGVDVSGKGFQEVVRKEVNNMLSKGLLVIGAGGAAEFETGLLQEAAEIGIEEIYDALKGSEAFNNPDNVRAMLDQLMFAGVAESVGGKIMSTPSAIVTAVSDGDFSQVSPETFKLFEEIRSMENMPEMTRQGYVAELKKQILAGTLTQKEADKNLSVYDQVIGVSNQIPDNLPLEQKQQLLGNLLRQQELKDYVDKYDKQLTKKQQKELKELEANVENILREGEAARQESEAKKIFIDYAIKSLQNEGVQNPSPRQIEMRMRELDDAKKKILKSVSSTVDKVVKDAKKETTPKPEEVVEEKVTEEVTTPKQELTDKTKQDAIQKPSTEKVDAQVQTQDGRQVGKSDTQGAAAVESQIQSETDIETKGKKKVKRDIEQEVKDLDALISEQTGRPREIVTEQETDVTVEPTPATGVETDVTVEPTPATDVETAVQEEVDTTPLPEGEVEINNSEGVKTRMKGRKIAENVTITEQSPTETQTEQVDFITNVTQNAASAVKNLMPNLNFVLHNSQQDFDFVVAPESKGSRAVYNPTTNTIHISIPKANNRSVAHEVMHAVVVDRLGVDPNINKITKRMLNAALKSIKNPKIKQDLQKFAKDYEAGVQNEEQVSELFGMLASNYTKLDYSTKDVVKRWIQKIAKTIGLPVNITRYTEEDADIIEFFNVVSKKVRKGKEIKDTDVEVIEKIKVPKKETKKKTPKKETKKKEPKKKEPKKKEDTQKEKQQKAGIDKLIQMYNMNPKGFIGPNIGNSLPALKNWAASLGYGVGRAQVRDKSAYDYGRTTGYFLTKNGRMVNPRLKERQQKIVNENQQEVFNKEDNAIDIINKARNQNFTDPAIKDYLTRVRKFPVREVNELMKVNADLLTTIPPSLGNLVGGMNNGIKLYTKVFKKYNQLRKANIQSKVKKTEQEIMDETMEFLRNQPEFKKVGDKKKIALSSQQRLIEIDIARALGGKQSSDLANALKTSRLILNSKKLGQREIKKVQQELRNFLRKTLPKDVYTKSDVSKLLLKLSQANKDNIQNIQNEIIEFAAEKNNKILEAEVQKLLNPKDRIKINNILKGVKIDDDTRKRIENIRNKVYPKKAFKTEDEVNDYLNELEAEYNKISEVPNKKEGDFTAMADLEIIMKLVNANNLMGDNDINKVSSLSTVVTALKDIMVTGRTALKEQLQKAHLEYRRQFEQVYRDVVGREESFEDQAIRELQEEGIAKPTDIQINDKISDIIEDIRKEQPDLDRLVDKKNKTRGRAKKIVNSIFQSMGDMMAKNSDMSLLMAKISKLPGELFGGKTQAEVTERIDEASRSFKERTMIVNSVITTKAKELFGKKWKKLMSTDYNQKSIDIISETEAIKKAEVAYEQNPTEKNKNKLDDEIGKRTYTLSPNELYYLYNQYKDPLNHAGLQSTFDTDQDGLVKIMNEITSTLESEKYKNLKAFADWQVDILYPSLYQYYNQAYKDIYRIDMPYNVNYAGMVYRDVDQKDSDPGINLLAGMKPQYHNVVSANSTKMRQDNKRAIKPTDGTNALFTYVRDMEYFAAFARPISDINKIFTNPVIRKTIKRVHGENTNKTIDAAIQKIANKGMSKEALEFGNAVNIMQDAFVLSRLGLSPVITLKQLTSAPAYAAHIGYRNWFKNASAIRGVRGESIKGAWKEIKENSVYLKDRQKENISKALETYTEDKMVSYLSGANRQKLLDYMMFNVRLGDIGAIYLGGVPNYVYYKNEFKKNNPKATEQEAINHAIRLFERDTKRTQQSTDLQDRDYFQTKGAFSRAMNMFLTQPKQYLRQEVYAIREFYRLLASGGKQGKGTKWQHTRVFLTYHVVLPMLFQWVANGLPGFLADWDEEDESDLARAAILGNINGLFIIGDIISNGADLWQRKPESFLEAKNLTILTQSQIFYKKFNRYLMTKDPDKKEQRLMELIMEGAQFTGLPANNLRKIYLNAEELVEGGEDPARVIMRLFNYSEYQIQSEKERNAKKKKDLKRIRKKSSKRKKKRKTDNPMEDDLDVMSGDNPMIGDNPMESDNPMD